MQTFFFPMLWLLPEFEGDIFESNEFIFHKRNWEVSIFDLYSLVAKRHPLRLSAELMHVFLGNVNLEVEVSAENYHDATERLEQIRMLLCIHGVAPTIAPFASNISLNKYAGINDRSAGEISRAKMHEGLREGITHETARVETWGHELSFSCIQGPADVVSRKVTNDVLQAVARDIGIWSRLEQGQGELRAARKALVKAPLMPDLGSSILHAWQGIESLFPSVNAEVTFRTSILLAMLLARFEDKVETFNKSKKSYGVRSKIAHGSQAEINLEQWMQAWSLLRDAAKSAILWGRLPSEQDLTTHLVGGSSF